MKEEPLEIDVNEALVREEDAAVDANRALHEEAVVWADKCTFQCRICSEYSTNNGGHFYRHIRKEHNLGGGETTIDVLSLRFLRFPLTIFDFFVRKFEYERFHNIFRTNFGRINVKKLLFQLSSLGF